MHKVYVHGHVFKNGNFYKACYLKLYRYLGKQRKICTVFSFSPESIKREHLFPLLRLRQKDVLIFSVSSFTIHCRNKIALAKGLVGAGVSPYCLIHERDSCLHLPTSSIAEKPKKSKSHRWYIKPATGSLGKGIEVHAGTCDDIEKLLSQSKYHDMVAQAEISPPLLLNTNRGAVKFDARFLAYMRHDGHYVVYPDAMLRCASKRYSPQVIQNNAYITNVSLQRHKIQSMTLASLRNNGRSQNIPFRLSDVPGIYLKASTYADGPTLVRRGLELIGFVLKHLYREWKKGHTKPKIDSLLHPNNRVYNYSPIGFDIGYDANGKAWLIEMNCTPGVKMMGHANPWFARRIAHQHTTA